MPVQNIPLPWEQLLWSGRPVVAWGRGVRYLLTDLRLVRIDREGVVEIAFYDIADIQRTESRLERLIGASTISVRSRRRTEPIVLSGVRRGAQLAALIELLSSDPRATIDVDTIGAALRWDPRDTTSGTREALAGIAVVLIAIFGVAIGLHGRASTITYAADDPIYPNGEKRGRREIVRFMEGEVMPWARVALGRIKGGPERISCETCHGEAADARDWYMPAVAALPAPDVREFGYERYSGAMDAQMRNAIYGYSADSEKQTRAAYMREVVMPGMAGLLHRPAYDFTKTYDYNRSRLAFGCYHCHRVK